MNASAPVWANPQMTAIDLIVDHPEFGPIPFTASVDDVEAHGRELFGRALAGEFGAIGNYIAPPPIVPASISRRQCAAEMFSLGLISGTEAVAMTTTATPPAFVEAALSAMPDPDQTFARIDFGAATYMRSNPFLVSLMESTGATATDIDGFFIAAAAR